MIVIDEQLVKTITELVLKKITGERLEKEEKIPIGVSARHIHLTKAHVDILFGKGYELKKKKELMGGQYACEELVTIVGTKLRAIENVRILGPERSKTQVEVARTDAVKLGINPPVRDSGKIEKSSPIAIVGPKGALYLEEGCIIAKRHIHMSIEDAEHFGVKDGELVSVKVLSDRSGIFSDVMIRVDKSFTLEMHIDTDEANGLGINCGEMGLIL